MNLEEARIKFADIQRKICAINHATALIYYDGETTAPPDTTENRTHALGVLNEDMFKLRAGDETVELLEYLDERKFDLTVRERRTVEFMLKEIKKKKLIPLDEYVEYENLLIEAQYVWREAVEESNFKKIRPFMERIFDVSRAFAGYCSPDMDPYEYCLDTYEEGLTIETCDTLFESIRNEIVPLLQAIKEKPQVDDSCVKGDFPVEAQEALAFYLMELVGLNMNRVGLGTAEHPFTTYLGSHFDSRIATRYSKTDYTSSMYTVLHSAGHVHYDMGQDDSLAYTVLDGGASMGLLESQARFYENVIGRSRTFIEYIFPEMVELFPEALEGKFSEELYRAVNKVEPTLIRIDSDELTSNLHYMIRYEIEKAVIHGDLAVKDMPEVWNAKYKEYLGLDVPDDANGILQDIHWPFGAIGYFPVYVVGAAYGALITEKMREDISVEDCLRNGEYDLINLWNRQHIWKHGGLYKPKDILEKQVGVTFSADAYIKYLKDKYKEIYRL